jgi:hypothetical protein
MLPAPKTIRVAVANSKRFTTNRAPVQERDTGDDHAASGGKMPVNFELVRGAAIMEATVSRQLA